MDKSRNTYYFDLIYQAVHSLSGKGPPGVFKIQETVSASV